MRPALAVLVALADRPGALQELKRIYAAAGAEDRARLVVSKGKGHEMDVEALLAFLNGK